MTHTSYSASKGVVFFRTASLIVSLVFSLWILSTSISAQEPDDEAPPPLKQLSKSEKQKLESETDVKRHTSVALELMNQRMENAETLNSSHHFDDMYKEIGSFNALMDTALKFLTSQDKDRNKVLNNFKRLDIGLRAFLPRLEIIRRDLPSQYEPYIRSVIKFISEAREKALEPMFGNTVVPDKPDH